MKTTKRILSAVLAAALTISMSAVTVSADKWVSTTNGTQYQYTDGTYAKSKWLTTTTGKKYYIKSNGIRATGLLYITNTDKTKDLYYFNSNGIMQIGWITVGKNTYYFQTSGKAVLSKKVKIGNYAYKFNEKGYWDGKVYSADGKKDVTKTVDVSKLVKATTGTATSSDTSTTSSGTVGQVKKLDSNEKIPSTITIKGIKYSTSEKFNPNLSGKNTYTKQYINIKGCTDADLECLKYMQNIKHLMLVAYDETENSSFPNHTDAAKITNLDFLYYLPNLEYITIENAPYLTNIDGLSVCKNLKGVTIKNAPITNVDALSNLTKIQTVTFSSTYLDNLNGLKNAVNLKTLYCDNAYLTDISGLANKNKLTLISLVVNRRLKDISALATCGKLETLYLSGCTAVENWDVLKKSKSLTYLACLWTRKGETGPTAVVNWLNKNGVTAKYDSAWFLGSEGHPEGKEMAIDMSWDYSNRPKNVYGDDIKCGCSLYCSNDIFSAWPKEFWLGYEKVK